MVGSHNLHIQTILSLCVHGLLIVNMSMACQNIGWDVIDPGKICARVNSILATHM